MVASITLDKPGLAETQFTTHYVEYEHSGAVVAVKNATQGASTIWQ
ncbi:MAG TPA: hypothetical protein VIS96_16565 [Terrimicrobiaceae bacterium]